MKENQSKFRLEGTTLTTQAGKKKKLRTGQSWVHRLRALPSGELPEDKLKLLEDYERMVYDRAIKLIKAGSNKTLEELKQIGFDTLMQIGWEILADFRASTYIYENLKHEMAGSDDGIPRVAVKPPKCTKCKSDKKNPKEITCHYFDSGFYCPCCGATYPGPKRYSHVSLDSYVGGGDDDDGMQLHEMLASSDPSPEDEARHAQLRRFIAKLQPMEQEIIYKRNWKGMGLEEIGNKHGYTKERVRQIEERAEQKLRKMFEDKQRELGYQRNAPIKPKGKAKSQKDRPGASGKRKQKACEEILLF